MEKSKKSRRRKGLDLVYKGGEEKGVSRGARQYRIAMIKKKNQRQESKKERVRRCLRRERKGGGKANLGKVNNAGERGEHVPLWRGECLVDRIEKTQIKGQQLTSAGKESTFREGGGGEGRFHSRAFMVETEVQTRAEDERRRGTPTLSQRKVFASS